MPRTALKLLWVAQQTQSEQSHQSRRNPDMTLIWPSVLGKGGVMLYFVFPYLASVEGKSMKLFKTEKLAAKYGSVKLFIS